MNAKPLLGAAGCCAIVAFMAFDGPDGVAGDVHAAELVSPVAVPLASGPAFPQGRANGNPPDPEYAADRAIDGDPATFCCLLDDTLGGPSTTTIPAKAAAPVTGHVVFDLGRPVPVVGARLTARTPGGPYNPKEVDFFCFADDDPGNHPTLDDIQGDAGIRLLLGGHTFGKLLAGASEDVSWDPVRARYVGIRVQSSYESGGPVHYNFQIGEMEFFVDLRPEELGPGLRPASRYVKQDTLRQTMLASRRQYLRWYEGLKPSAGQIAKLWEQIRRDHPPRTNRLLDYAHYDWLEPSGWFVHADDTELEQRLIRRAIDETGPAGKPLQKRLDALLEAETPADDPQWLGLCVTAAEVALLEKELENLRAAIEDLERSFPDRYPCETLLGRVQEIEGCAIELTETAHDAPASAFRPLGERLESLRREALVDANPLMPRKLLFVKRYTYSPGWYYAEFMRASRFGGNLCVLSLDDGKVTELVPELAGGIFDRYDLSFDARRVTFGYKAAPGKGFRIYEAGVDGRGLRQLTFDPPDEPERIAKYWHPRNKPSGVYRHHTDDFHPCYLPDGGIALVSTRCEQGVLCDQGDSLAVNVLYRMDADGGRLARLSQGALSESTPSVAGDGRILYTRWEYVDKGVIAVQALWAMHPDGACSAEIYGNQIEEPPVLIHGRAVPGVNHLFVATATMHHPFAVGPILLVDTHRDVRTHGPIRSLTPDTSLSIEGVGGFPNGENYIHFKNGRWVADNVGPLYSEPYPLADPETGSGAGKYFLVDGNPDRAWNDPAAYGLYLIDAFGNRVRIHDDPEISCWQPVPLAPRSRPPVISPVRAEELAAKPVPAGEAVVMMTDVYRGLEGVERGRIKYLRVLEQVPRPWSARRFWPEDEGLGQHAIVSMYAHIFVTIHHGVVPVREDGSACFVVPAEKNLFFEALDEDFMEVQRMRSFVNFRPGEARSCIGCHEERRLAPPPRTPLALAYPPSRLGPQPGETVPRPLYYPTDVQPILDKHCVECHNPSKPDGDLDLSGELTTFFNRSYEQVMAKKLVAYIQEFHGPQPRAQKTNVVPLAPRSLGSHASRLITVLRDGHYDAKLSREEMVRLVTWADANAPYYGSYFGRRNLIYKDHPDFRPLPTLESASGIPPNHGTP
ncbi:MAG TPA: hypothetical protein VMY37_26430 [Thermoguttaceae bacterium]|nr:hypothetical protein [Thermoguttaceae bacterium]